MIILYLWLIITLLLLLFSLCYFVWYPQTWPPFPPPAYAHYILLLIVLNIHNTNVFHLMENTVTKTSPPLWVSSLNPHSVWHPRVAGWVANSSTWRKREDFLLEINRICKTWKGLCKKQLGVTEVSILGRPCARTRRGIKTVSGVIPKLRSRNLCPPGLTFVQRTPAMWNEVTSHLGPGGWQTKILLWLYFWAL